jgi:putative transport protein
VITLLADNPILLLFCVAAVGYLVGQLRLAGFSLGVAAVLFAGIAFGALDRRLLVPEEIRTLGLAIFVYTIGVASGPGFFGALRRRGLSANLGALGALGAGAVAAAACARAFASTAATAAGTFAGAVTNTPALAGVVDYLQKHDSAGLFDRVGAQPVVGYSLTYPVGVLAPLLTVYVLLRRARAETPVGGRGLVNWTAKVDGHAGETIAHLSHELDHEVAFARVQHDGAVLVAEPGVELALGDLVSVVGTEQAVRRAVELVGERSHERLGTDRSELEMRRIAVSSHAVAGRTVDDLDLHRFHAVATRVRRGDTDFVARPDLVLELGDRVRVVAPRSQLRAVSELLGDSYRKLRELDVLTFSLGIAVGMLIGLIPIPLLGGGSFTLGFAGGPLIAGLVLGALARTGPLVWQLPHASNMALRQFGTVLFLAGIGTKAGQSFASTVMTPTALLVLASGIAISCAVLAVTVVVGTKVLHLRPTVLAGMIAGVETQPAVLAFAIENADDETEVSIGCATVYPVAMIAKIVLAQVILTSLG